MRNFIKIICLVIILLILTSTYFRSVAMSHYQVVGTTTGIVTASTLNVRQGPGTNYKKVTQIYKNEYVRIFAKIGDWYVIQTEKDFIGSVSSKYVRLVYLTHNNGTSNNSNSENKNTNSELTEDEKEVFELINEKRKANGLTALKINDDLQNVARIKAQDMVDNNYFSHTSPTYGSPFNMIKKFGITYKTAGENIAGNSTNKGAVEAWMNSEGHKANILSSNYNYTGVAVVKSQKYGKIYVQMFIGK